jgi:hypothetical protein
MLRLEIPIEGRRQRMQNFFCALISCDLNEYLDFFDRVVTFLLEDNCDIEGFKAHQCHSLDGVDVSRGLLSPINTAIYGYLTDSRVEVKAHFLAISLQHLKYSSKLEFRAVGLEDQALEKYLEAEEELATMGTFDSDMVNSLSAIMRDWLNGSTPERKFEIRELKPNHGPGSVAEGNLTPAQKFHRLSCDKKLAIVLSGSSDDSIAQSYYPLCPGTHIDRTSRTVFVPKTATKLRTISMEPASLQYIQQGVMKEIYRFIERHPYLGCRIRLSDQTQNQVLALEGSKYGNLCTIDLSHASDSVSWDLVKRVFRSVPHLYKWLIATRSFRTELPDGTLTTLHKYAPMGSALCFPIECLLFACAVEHALRQACTPVERSRLFYSVYGDDLVVPTKIAEYVIDILSRMGFTVNRRKTFISGPYRESCGKEYYAGIDISVLYYRIPFYNERVSPSAYASMCGMCNNAYLHRLPNLRSYFISKILDSRRLPPYFEYSPEVSPGLYSPTPTNFRMKARWNKGLQRFEGRAVSVKSRPRSDEPGDDTLRYFIKLVEMAWRDSSRPIHDGESSLPYAMQGCVEFFSSTTVPVVPFVRVSRTSSHDWDGT